MTSDLMGSDQVTLFVWISREKLDPYHWSSSFLVFYIIDFYVIDFCAKQNFFKTKGQLISKANCQAMNSSKKRTNEFVFTTMRRVFVRFLEEIEVTKKTFRNYLTFIILIGD